MFASLIIIHLFVSIFAHEHVHGHNLRHLDDTNHNNIDTLKQRLNDGIDKATELYNLIYYRYEMNNPLGELFIQLHTNMRKKDWEILKYKFILKLLSSSPSDYLMIFGGTSVTAGHDNYFNQSYPMIFQKRMTPVFNALGIDLIVHNIAQGANDCLPSDLCYEAMGGSDADFYGWEQTFNCGRSPEYREIIAKMALWSKRRGVLYVAGSGGILPRCNESTVHPPHSDENWTPTKDVKKISLSKEIITKQFTNFIEYNSHKPSFADLGKFINDAYPGIVVLGTHNFQAYPDKACEKASLDKGQCNIGAIFNTCQLKFTSSELQRFGQGHGKNWHPTVGLHMLRGEVLSWTYLFPMMDAAFTLLSELQSVSGTDWRQPLITRYQGLLNSAENFQIPKSKTCSSFDCNHQPRCYTDYTPHFHTNYTFKDILVTKNPKWIHTKQDIDATSSRQGRDAAHFEARPSYQAISHTQGNISFAIQVGEGQKIMVCGYKYHADNHKNMEYFVALNASPSEATTVFQVWINVKQVGPCAALLDVPMGNHIVSVVPKKARSAATQPVGITHIITW